MTPSSLSLWTRRRWLASHAVTVAALMARVAPLRSLGVLRSPRRLSPATATRVAAQAERLDPGPWQALAQQAVDAAHSAGARYADVRFTRRVVHTYNFAAGFYQDEELVGVGVRALVNGYWGFSASTSAAPDEVVRLAQDAAAQARVNATGTPWTVELGTVPVATGTWTTPIRIDPFAVPIEEHLDYMRTVIHIADHTGIPLKQHGYEQCNLWFLREERVVATSEGSRFMQTLYETKGLVTCGLSGSLEQEILSFNEGGGGNDYSFPGLELAGVGYELILDAKIPEQFLSGQMLQRVLAQKAAQVRSKIAHVGRYPIVCDGATMGRIIEATLGGATQLDRALGYEANTLGTSVFTDPLGMVGQAQVASPLVTLTANRSEPRQLATVKWDDEGVEPDTASLITHGVLTDFQTTREQAAWLAPYYHRHNLPVRSHGYAMAESAHFTPLQQMPNLALAPNASPIGVQDLIANIQDGLFVAGGNVITSDSQGRTGLLMAGGQLPGQMWEIRNGRLAAVLNGGAILFDSMDLWKKLTALGGSSTQMVVSTSKVPDFNDFVQAALRYRDFTVGKGLPPQFTSYSISAPAATLPPQALINPEKKA